MGKTFEIESLADITALSILKNILGMECKGLGGKRITISNILKQEYYGKV